MEKERNKSSKRKNKKSLSSLIRKLFGKKNRRSNNPTKDKEREAVAVDYLSNGGVCAASPLVTEREESNATRADNSEEDGNAAVVDTVQDRVEDGGANEIKTEEKVVSEDSGIASVEEMKVDDSGLTTETVIKIQIICNHDSVQPLLNY